MGMLVSHFIFATSLPREDGLASSSSNSYTESICESEAPIPTPARRSTTAAMTMPRKIRMTKIMADPFLVRRR